MIKKILYLLKQRYNPYHLYWFDLLTERQLKNRKGNCVECIECCRYNCGSCKCYCNNADLEHKRCKIYDNRKCNIWFPVSQKEIDCRIKVQPGFKCKFSFQDKK